MNVLFCEYSALAGALCISACLQWAEDRMHGRSGDSITFKTLHNGSYKPWAYPHFLMYWMVECVMMNKYPSPRWGLVSNTSCWGGGGAKGPPEISQTTGPISKFQTPFDSPVRELPVQCQKFDPDVTYLCVSAHDFTWFNWLLGRHLPIYLKFEIENPFVKSWIHIYLTVSCQRVWTKYTIFTSRLSQGNSMLSYFNPRPTGVFL